MVGTQTNRGGKGLVISGSTELECCQLISEPYDCIKGNGDFNIMSIAYQTLKE